MDLLQLATQLGPTAGVVIVVVVFLRYLSAARREARADAVRMQRVIDRNTRAFVRFIDRTDRRACATSKAAGLPDLLKTLCNTPAGRQGHVGLPGGSDRSLSSPHAAAATSG